MRKNTFLTIILLFVIAPHAITAQELQKCWKKQGEALKNNILSFSFSENRSLFRYDSIPFSTMVYETRGNVSVREQVFSKRDTLAVFGVPGYFIHSMQFTTPRESHKLNYGSSICTRYDRLHEKYESQLVEASRYSPVPILYYFLSHKKDLRYRQTDSLVVYELKTKNAVMSIFINKETYLLTKISFLQSDPIFGDNNTIIEYNNYQELQNSIYVSKNSFISRYNGKIKDIVSMSDAVFVSGSLNLLPEHICEDDDEKVNKDLSIKVNNYNDHLHFVNLEHDRTRTLLVEFKNFFVAIEAPNTSENGDLIIAEAKKIAPEKPIKYFLFSHYHPSHLGGLRAFVHNGTTVVSTMDNFDFISYISKNKRTLNPDSLQIEPKRLDIEIMDKQKVITDGDYEMQVYVIGGESMKHTVFYFPAEKLLFEGDLIHLPGYYARGGTSHNMERELLEAIKTLDLDVDTIVQSSYEDDAYSALTIPYSDFEKFVLSLGQ